MPRSANSASAADKSAPRVPVDLSERAGRMAGIASVHTARHIKSSCLFNLGYAAGGGGRSGGVRSCEIDCNPRREPSHSESELESEVAGMISSFDRTRGPDRQRIEWPCESAAA